MNIEQRKNLGYRFLASFLLLIPIGVMIFSLLQIIVSNTDDYVLSIIAVSACAAFNLFEIIVIIRGWTKESHLYAIAFAENDRVNNPALVAVIVGTVFGVGLTSLSLAVYLVREEINVKIAMLVVLTISSYLLINCIIYYIYLLIFKKRELNLRDLIK